MKRSIIVLAAVFTLAVTACTTENSTTDTDLGPVGGEGIFAAGAAVEPFDSCSEFLDYVKRHAI